MTPERRGQRVIYTTPLKALSNQKLREMRARFGKSRVGLQTGDASLALDSDIVVMTTEVLRNIMYRVDRRSAGAAAEPECPLPAALPMLPLVEERVGDEARTNTLAPMLSLHVPPSWPL